VGKTVPPSEGETGHGVLQALLNKKAEVKTEELWQALVQNEESNVARTSKFGARIHINLDMWRMEPVLDELLAYWTSAACHLKGNNSGRLNYIRKFIAYERNDLEDGELDLESELTNTSKIQRYLDVLAAMGQKPATIVKSVDVIVHALHWWKNRKLLSGAPNFSLRFQICTQAKEILRELRTAWHKVSKQDVECTTSLASIIRANKWPSDEQVCSGWARVPQG